MDEIFVSGDTLLELCEEQKIPISEASIQRESKLTHKSKKEIEDELANC